MTRLARALLVVCLLLMPIVASAENASIRGELLNVSGAADRLTVVLNSLERSSSAQTAFVGANGSFQFHSVPQGTYMIEVRNPQGDIVKQQIMTVAAPAVETSISLGTRQLPAMPVGGATVSVDRLRRDPEGRAVREYSLGAGFLLKQDLANARKHLMKAVKADPDYAEAHLELGTTAFRLGQMGEAREEFERAVTLDPKQTTAWGNLASLLFQTKAYPEAEDAADKGLRASPLDAKLHFIAGASRYARGELNQDTAEHLEEASKHYPNAHLLLAETLLRLGQVKNALIHLKASLVSSNAEVRDRARYLMTRLAK